jgi:hypothetical protein
LAVDLKAKGRRKKEKVREKAAVVGYSRRSICFIDAISIDFSFAIISLEKGILDHE